MSSGVYRSKFTRWRRARLRFTILILEECDRPLGDWQCCCWLTSVCINTVGPRRQRAKPIILLAVYTKWQINLFFSVSLWHQITNSRWSLMAWMWVSGAECLVTKEISLREESLLALFPTVNVAALHIYWISCAVDNFTFHYMHSHLSHLSIGRGEWNCFLVSITDCENVPLNKWGYGIPCGKYVNQYGRHVEVIKKCFLIIIINLYCAGAIFRVPQLRLIYLCPSRHISAKLRDLVGQRSWLLFVQVLGHISSYPGCTSWRANTRLNRQRIHCFFSRARAVMQKPFKVVFVATQVENDSWLPRRIWMFCVLQANTTFSAVDIVSEGDPEIPIGRGPFQAPQSHSLSHAISLSSLPTLSLYVSFSHSHKYFRWNATEMTVYCARTQTNILHKMRMYHK